MTAADGADTELLTETDPPLGTSVGPGHDARQTLEDERPLSLEERAEIASRRGPKPVRTVSARINVGARLAELWRSKELFVFLVRKEIKVKYKNSVLGFMWSMLNPALTLSVFWVLFTFFIPSGVPNFVIYMFAALLVWNFYQNSAISGTSSVVANAGIVKKVSFPREILPLASVGTSFVFFLFQSIVMMAFLLGFWHRPDWSAMWLLVPALLAIVAFSAAVSTFVAAVNVYYRDTQHLVEVLLLAWFWAIPGVYAFSGTVHDKLARHHVLWLFFLNPVTPPAMTFQRVLYNMNHPVSTVTHQPIPHGVLATYPTAWYAWSDVVVFAVSVLLFFGAMVLFGRLAGNFAEEL